MDATPFDFFVSPHGNDHWSGTSADPNAAADGPFASLDRARRAAADLRRQHPGLARPITIGVRGGTYFSAEPLRFTPDDSGTAASPTVFQSFDSERPVISAGVRITNWTIDGRGWWHADLPDVRSGNWSFTQLFVNGQRRARPRLPRDGFFLIDRDVPQPPENHHHHDRFGFRPGDLRPDWHNLGDVEILVIHIWAPSRFRIKSVEPDNVVTFTGRTYTSQFWQHMKAGHRYYADNVREALGEPGDFYLDRAAGTLTYVPMPGERPDNTEVIAPRFEHALLLAGDMKQGRFVEHIHFRGLAFAHSNWTLPPQGMSCPQAEMVVPAAIDAEAARHCVFDACSIEHTSGYGIELAIGCAHNEIINCELTDLGAGGVKIGTSTAGWTLRPRPVDLTADTAASHNIVRNCRIAHGGRFHIAAVGVWIAQSHHNLLERCEIADFRYTGVSVGWTWGSAANFCHDNRIDRNHIHHVSGPLSDLGGVYTLGVSPGTVVSGNHIHHIETHEYGGWGLYTDEGSCGILFENNIVHHCQTGSFHQHHGRDNTLRNNIFAFAGKWQLQLTKAESHRSFTFTRNIVYWESGPLFEGPWADAQLEMDSNLYWNTSGDPITFGALTFDEWRQRGRDAASLIADPKFISVAGFTLPPDSPADTIGFSDIDTGDIGLLNA